MIKLVIVFFVIDLISKILISNNLVLYKSYVIIDNFFNLTYVKNTGAAWSILSNKIPLLIIISSVIIILSFIYIYKNKARNNCIKVSYAMILGGSIGNWFDRIVYGYVIDFFDFNIFGYNFPIFNLADTFIVLGIIIYIIGTWRD